MRVKSYQIFKDISFEQATAGIPVDRQPLYVAALLDEQDFLSNECKAEHLRNIFIHDEMHDWKWKNQTLRYFANKGPVHQIIVIFEIDKKPDSTPQQIYCTHCGTKLINGACPNGHQV